MSGTWAKGATLSVDVEGTPTLIGNLTDIGFPDISVDEVDVSSHDSADNFREFVPGMIDGGSIDLEGNYTADNGILDYLKAGNVLAFTVKSASGKEAAFDGFFTAFTVELPFEDKEAFSATVKVSGGVEITDAAAV